MNDNELVNTRIIDAPREKVFEAWTDQAHIGEWFGPDGFITTTESMDVRPGGEWRFIMKGPDGTAYNSLIKYVEVQKPERLVLAYNATPEHSLKEFSAEVTFEDLGGKTKLTLRHIFLNAEERVKQEGIGAVEGGNQTLNRLEAYLTKST
jgi:uncharacterized protein YndB with AHSA1/START domain